MSDSSELPSAWVARDPKDVAARAHQWLSSPTLRNLVRKLAGSEAEGWDHERMLAWTAGTLDTRRGGERRDSPTAEWSRDWVDALIRAALPLGLIETRQPQRRFYDVAVILGGATTGNRMRVELARELIAGGTRFGKVVALSAERPLGAREHDSEPDSVNDATEWRNLLRCLTDAFGLLSPTEQTSGGEGHQAWRDDLYGTQTGELVQLLVAPSRDPARRANTSDAVAFLSRRLPRLAGSSALVITSAIYVPYQFFAAAPDLLSAGLAHLELAGTRTSLDGARPLLAQGIAQEIHAAVDAATRLMAAQ